MEFAYYSSIFAFVVLAYLFAFKKVGLKIQNKYTDSHYYKWHWFNMISIDKEFFIERFQMLNSKEQAEFRRWLSTGGGQDWKLAREYVAEIGTNFTSKEIENFQFLLEILRDGIGFNFSIKPGHIMDSFLIAIFAEDGAVNQKMGTTLEKAIANSCHPNGYFNTVLKGKNINDLQVLLCKLHGLLSEKLNVSYIICVDKEGHEYRFSMGLYSRNGELYREIIASDMNELMKMLWRDKLLC